MESNPTLTKSEITKSIEQTPNATQESSYNQQVPQTQNAPRMVQCVNGVCMLR